MRFKDVQKVYKIFRKEINEAPCSSKHHLNVVGGLQTHLKHVFEIAQEFFPKEKSLHYLAAVHDIGKARCYKIGKDRKVEYTKPSVDHILHTISMLNEVGIVLTSEELNTLQFHHGGWSGLRDGRPSEMAVKLHFCDMLATVREEALEK